MSGDPAAADPVETTEVTPESEEPDKEPEGRPDLVSASVTARATGRAVEDLSQRSETVRVLVNPDGTLTQESYAAAVRVETSPDVWQDVDYDLVKKSDGSFGPRVAPADVSIGAGGSKDVASLAFADGGEASLSWPEELPEPSVEGSVATFKVSESTDLLVALTARGLVTHIRLNEAPAAGDTAFTLGLQTEGVSVDDTADNELKFVKGGRTAVETTASVVAWDSKVDVAGDPVDVVPVEVSVDQGASEGGSTNHEVELVTPPEFLSDPATEYPVIIDPDIAAVSFGQDTWLRSGTTTPYGDDYRLLVGRVSSHSNQNHTISMLNWDNAQLSGRNVLKATLSLYQYHSGTCSARVMNIHPLAGPFSESTTTWANRPGLAGGTSASASLTQNRGGSGCTKNGPVTADVKKLVQGWAKGSAGGGFANNGIQLNVPNDKASDLSYERRFCSSEFLTTHTTCNNVAVVPSLSVTYNGPPEATGVATAPASRTYDGKIYVSAERPAWQVSAADPEASKVAYTVQVWDAAHGAQLGSCTSGLVAAGSAAGCAPAYDLADGADYTLRTQAVDEHGLAGDWSPWQEFTADLVAPSLPSITCDGYGDQSWTTDRAAESTTCEFTASNAADFEWRRTAIGQTEDQPAVTAAGGAATTPGIPVPANGVVKVEARAKSKSGLGSDWKTYTFGIGASVLTEPIRDDRSTATFPVQASAEAGATSARIQWRYAPDDEGDTTTGWADATKIKLADTGAAWTGNVSGTGISSTPRLKWTPSTETGITNPSVVQVRVVFTYPGSVQLPSPLQRIQVIPHAFGSSFPVQDVGPGQVGLFTGELQFSEDDVALDAAGAGLSFSRSHLSLAGAPAGPAGVLGPGWVADFGTDAGASGFVVTDNSGLDGTITLLSPDGESYTYGHTSGTKASLKAGTYTGIGETKLEEDTLVLAAVTGESGISHKLTLTEIDGTRTEFKRTTGGVWSTSAVTEPEDNSTTRYVRDTDGTVQVVHAPTPAGQTCNGATSSSWTKGCKGLRFTYTTVSGAGKRLAKVEYFGFDPQPSATTGLPGNTGSTVSFRDVQKYSYDTDGKLTAAWSPTNSGDTNPLKTQYSYADVNGKTVVTQITDPGLKPWRFNFDGQGRLETVKRAQDAAVGSGDATWTVAYDLPLSGSGLPDLTPASVNRWGQLDADAPTGGAAVFEPDRVPSGSPTAADYEYASLSYFTRAGRSTNAASYGAGAWQIDSTRYDAHGNTTWALEAAGRNKALAEGSSSVESAAAADKYATFTLYNPTGTRVENTYSPMRPVTLDNGQRVVGRTVTATDYDDEADGTLMPGRPTSDVPAEGFGLAVEERAAVTDKINPGADGGVWDTRKTQYRYDKVVAGDGDGWALKTPTRVKTQDGSGWSTTLTRFDTDGRVVETRTPAGTAVTDGTANDVRSTKTIYYTADTSATDSACRSKPHWDGLVCLVKPGGPPSAGAAVPTSKTTGYSMISTPTRVEEVGGTATRAEVSAFDYAERSVSTGVAVTGTGATSTAVADKATSYSTTTGVITQTVGAKTQTYSYDTWGRVVSQTDGVGTTTTTSYDTAGRVASSSDGKGTSTFTYDGTDSRGKAERRGLVTAVDVGLPSGPDVFTGAYDADGALVEQNYPGGTSATWTRDVTGAETGLVYAQGGDQLMGFTHELDQAGRVRRSVGPGETQTYDYDERDRLTKVQDVYQGFCTTRTYGFDTDSNRTNAKTFAPNSGGVCQSATALTDVSSAYDTADRTTNTGYVHDLLGRATKVAKAHTDQAAASSASDLTVGYHANDMVASLSQTIPGEESGTVVSKQDFTLDGSDRVSTIKSLTDNVQLAEQTNHYDSDTDSPAWSETKTRPDASTAWQSAWSRNVSGLAGDLALTQASDGTFTLQLPNLHDDLAATVALGATGIDGYTSFLEYGQTRDGAGGDFYGWLGAKQRQSVGITGGLTLMGARLYNPTTGRFTSMDPVAGGNDNTYIYPPDPVNKVDLSGEFWGVAAKWACKKFCKNAWKPVKKYAKRAWSSSKRYTKKFAGSVKRWSHQPHVTFKFRNHNLKFQRDKPNHNFKRGPFRGYRKHISITYWRSGGASGNQKRVQIPYGCRYKTMNGKGCGR